MNRILFALIAALTFGPAIAADTAFFQQNTVSSQPGEVVGTPAKVKLVDNGDGTYSMATASAGGGTLATQVQGNGAASATDTGNPVKIGGVYMTTQPTYTNGQRGDAQIGSRGALAVTLFGQNSATSPYLNNSSDTVVSGSAVGIGVIGFNSVFNGTSWDRMRGDTTGSFIVDTPTASASNALTVTSTAAVSSSLVLKGSAGNLYSYNVVAGAAAGFIMLFDATSAPADGAVTPKMCIPLAANTGVDRAFTKPIRFTTGITVAFSTTGCYLKTASVTAFIAGSSL